VYMGATQDVTECVLAQAKLRDARNVLTPRRPDSLTAAVAHETSVSPPLKS